jgi:hypothetical protein
MGDEGKKGFKAKAIDVAAAIGLYREIQSPGAQAALVMSLKRAGKVGLAGGIGFGLIIAVGALQQDATNTELLKFLFALVPAQAIVAAISKYLKEHYGITLPF